MDFNNLTRGERIVLVAGALLILDLLALPWHRYGGSVSVLGTTIHTPTFNRTAVQSPDSGWGILALLVAIVMVAQIVTARFTSATLPKPPVPWSQVHLIAGGVVLALLVLK